MVASRRGSDVLGLPVFSPAEPWMEKGQQQEEEESSMEEALARLSQGGAMQVHTPCPRALPFLGCEPLEAVAVKYQTSPLLHIKADFLLGLSGRQMG